jgi:hypothetical protein
MKKSYLIFPLAFLAIIFVSIQLTPTLAQNQPPAQGQPPEAQEQPPAQGQPGQPPEAQEQPPTQGQPPEAQEQPPTQGQPPEAQEQPPTQGQPPEAQEQPPTQGQPPEDKVETKLQKLKELLSAKKWEEADDLSYQVMLEIAGPKSQKEGRFITGEWEVFSCPELEKIDEMWSQASNGKFGFRAQREIFDSVNQNAISYYDKIGWKKENTNVWLVEWQYKKGQVFYTKKPDFNKPLLELPKGYLPGKLEWTDKSDHRFDMIYACPGLTD